MVSTKLAATAFLFVETILFPLSALYCQTYPFKLYSAVDGLAGTGVESIYQDSEGYLWFGTFGALNRYDGVSFRHYLDTSVQRFRVKCFYEDKGGTLWVGTGGNGIAKIDRQSDKIEWWKSAGTILPSDSIYTFFRDNAGNLWIGTSNGILVLTTDGRNYHFTTLDGLHHNWINQIAQQNDGTVWIATMQGVISCHFYNGRLIDVVSRVRAKTLAVLVAGDQSVYVGTAEAPTGTMGGVARFHGDRRDVILSFAQEKKAIKVMSLTQDSQGIIWAGTNFGVYYFEKGKRRRISGVNGLPHSYVVALFEDREATMWFGIPDGVVRLNRKHALFWDFQHRPAVPILRRILRASDGTIWFGGFEGLLQMDPRGPTVLYPKIDYVVRLSVHAFAEDEQGRIWIGSSEGLKVFNGRSFEIPSIVGLPKGLYSSMLFFSSGRKWFAAQGKIYPVENNRVQKIFDAGDGIPPYGLLLMTDRTGRIWFSAEDGGAGYIDADARAVRLLRELPDSKVLYLFEDSRGTLWISTLSGLYTLEGNTVRKFRSTRRSLDESLVRWIFEDQSGIVWFASSAGTFGWKDSVLTQFDRHDGVIGGPVNCGTQDSSGDLWFATQTGIVKIPARALQYHVPAPRVSIERLSDESIHQSLTLVTHYPHDETNLLFHFKVLSFFDEDNLEFRWRLEGIEDRWNHERARRTVRYSKLQPGSYVLSVLARNRGGAWSDPSTYTFEILPPYWETWWFRASILLAVIVSLFALYRYRIKRFLEIQRMRLRIASDLHDEIGSNLGSIALESQLMARRMNLPEEARNRLSTINRMAQETAQAMRDIVWLINPEHDRLDRLALKMRDTAGNMLKGTAFAFRVGDGFPEEGKLGLEVKRNLLLMFKEILHNIVKHARASNVNIELKVSDSQLILGVEDNGVGFQEGGQMLGHGLSSLKHRAGQIGGTVAIESMKGTGTRVEVRVSL